MGDTQIEERAISVYQKLIIMKLKLGSLSLSVAEKVTSRLREALPSGLTHESLCVVVYFFWCDCFEHFSFQR